MLWIGLCIGCVLYDMGDWALYRVCAVDWALYRVCAVDWALYRVCAV